MQSKVRVDKGKLNYFRRKARETNLEIQAYLIGKVVSPELTIIEKFIYPKQYAEQTANNVCWYLQDYNEVKKEAEEKGLRIVGDIHSHPNWFPVLSECDHRNHLADGQRITGICSTMQGRTKVYFWLAESSLPCKIEYV